MGADTTLLDDQVILVVGRICAVDDLLVLHEAILHDDMLDKVPPSTNTRMEDMARHTDQSNTYHPISVQGGRLLNVT